jgi:hypothetical protein
MPLIQIPITKGKGTVEIDTDAIPQEAWAEIIQLGLQTYCNKMPSKVSKVTYPVAEELQAAAMAVAAERVAEIMENRVKRGRTSASKTKGVSGAVMTEARRLARNLIKDEMKRQKIKVSHVEASEITKAANALLQTQPELIEQAKANLAQRDQVKVPIDVKAIPVSTKKVAAAEAKKAEGRKTTEDKKAAKGVVPRAKAKARPEAHAAH